MSATRAERELIFASFPDAAMGAVAEKALRELERQVESIKVGNIAVVSRDAEGEIHIRQAGHISPSRGALFGLIAGGLVGAAIVGLPLTVAIGTAAGIQAAAVAAGSLASAAASASATAMAAEAAVATGLSAAMSGGLGAALGGAAGSIASLFGFKEEELRLVGQDLAANHSAVIVLATPEEVETIETLLHGLGGSVRHGKVSQSLLDVALRQVEDEARRADAVDTTGEAAERGGGAGHGAEPPPASTPG